MTALRSSLALLIAVGAGLRLWGLGRQLPLADEHVPLLAAAQASYAQILTHFGFLDHCIPLTLWAKGLAGSSGLGEWGLRLPSALAGTLVVAVGAGAALRLLTAAEAVLVTGALSLSPYLVYLSREGRPYAIVMLLFGAACLLAFSWMRRGGRRKLLLGTTCGVLALWFHPIALAAGAVLALGVAVVAFGAGAERRRDALAACALGLGLAAFLIALPLRDLLRGMGARTGRGGIDTETMRYGLMLLHGGSWSPPLAAWLGLWALGALRLAARYRRETLWLCALIAAQLLGVWALQPIHAETTWIWLRYQAPLLPFLLLLSVLPLAALLEWAARRVGRPGLAAGAAGLVCATWLGAAAAAGRYPLATGAYNVHPLLAYVPRPPAQGLAPAPGAYARIASGDAGALIEAPMSLLFPVYGVYQAQHGRELYTAPLGDWSRQSFLADGMSFDRIVDLEADPLKLPADARYLVFHKDIRTEASRLYAWAGRSEPLRRQLQPAATMDRFWRTEFGEDPPALPPALRSRFPVIYEDELVVVYDLGTAREARDTRPPAALRR